MTQNHSSWFDAETIAKQYQGLANSFSQNWGGPSRAVLEFSRLLKVENIGVDSLLHKGSIIFFTLSSEAKTHG
jgi:hypothetical protein